uniref:Uncharacterized protein n=1 Tax=Cyprinus carpio TaxID=7962 RepID=A0A8C1MBU9_CYPCA
MSLYGLCKSLFLCFLSSFSIYLVTVSSQVVGGKTETLCAQIHEPKEPLSIVVTLRTDDRNLTILQQGSIKKDFYKCVPFKVPVVTVESVASIDVAIQGAKTSLNKTTKILINPPQNLLFIQSDKPIYKPGQTSNSSLCKLFRNSLSCQIGILDLSHSMSPEAAQGFYTITAWDAKNQQISHSFEIKEYVLPKYEVNIDFPSILTFQDKEVTLKVCAKYTYGKPVLGSVNAEVCSQSYGYYWRRPSPDMINICKKYSMTTDKTGCGSQVVNMTEFGLTSAGSLQVNCNVEESGTGITMQGSTSAQLTSDYVYVNFEDTPDTYRPGMVFKGKFVVTNSQSRPMKNESVIVYAHYDDKMINVTLKTDINGTARFSFNTLDWSEKPVQLQVYHKGGIERTDFEAFRYYPSGYHYIRPFHSKSKSFLMLTNAPEKLSCNSDATVTASYIIQGSALKTGQKTLDFFYIVLSRGSMAQNGRLSVSVNSGRGTQLFFIKLTFSLKSMAALTPYAQVVVYTVLPSGEAVADSMNFPIEECLPNKVSLKFSSPTALPGERTSLNLKASPGSLCSVRAIDQSVLLLRPEAELDAASVYKTHVVSGKYVNITVRAEAVQSRELCGNEVVTLPDKGRIDTVMQSVLVEVHSPQETSVSLTLPKVFVKDSAKSFVTVLGDLMGRALRNIGDLLAMPYGCGEQNMLRFAPNIYILQYLESTGQLTPQIKDRAITFLESGYQRELTYKHYDGSYSAFGNSDPSGNTWLTAFVMKSFGGARQYIFIDQNNIDQAKEWLGQQQQENGCFASVGRLFHIDMMVRTGESCSGVLHAAEKKKYYTSIKSQLDPMVVRSLTCLRESSSDITNTYVTALLSYTFTLAGDEQMRQNLISNLDNQARREGVGRYWTLANNVQPTGSLEVETSAYVLLALLSGPTLPRFGLNYSAGIVHWLSKQQNAYGGFSSTQDTVVALQALAKYSAAIYNPEGSITVTVTSPSGQKNQFTVNQNNRLLYQEKRLQEVTGTYKLRAEGKGCVFVQFALHYNIPPPPDSLAFKISANTGVCKNTTNPAFPLTTTVRYNGTRMETNMVIINVRFLSGFKPDETSLQAVNPTIKRVDLDEDRVIFYLDSLKKNQVKSISLQLVQEVQVQNLKPAVVIVYDYYKISMCLFITLKNLKENTI